LDKKRTREGQDLATVSGYWIRVLLVVSEVRILDFGAINNFRTSGFGTDFRILDHRATVFGLRIRISVLGLRIRILDGFRVSDPGFRCSSQLYGCWTVFGHWTFSGYWTFFRVLDGFLDTGRLSDTGL